MFAAQGEEISYKMLGSGGLQVTKTVPLAHGARYVQQVYSYPSGTLSEWGRWYNSRGLCVSKDCAFGNSVGADARKLFQAGVALAKKDGVILK